MVYENSIDLPIIRGTEELVSSKAAAHGDGNCRKDETYTPMPCEEEKREAERPKKDDVLLLLTA
jgi:hypothetical protein